MLTARARRRVAALRQPRRAARIARTLWIVWAVVVWNVVFDHTLVVAGRRYLFAVGTAAASHAPRVNMDDYMRPAVTRGLWLATLSASAILLVGLPAVRYAAREPQTPQVP
jgi:ABC-type Fe3+ transport system permease subunit